ncbi:TIGR03084 family protein [Nostocoides sp. F2B08]|uniref:TIGR03084 family metal-binding protein n=1 Tax=Nostocoides sp. F2B08 TaxID=2653936 RepID=UPI001263A10F|nr:TIGR03084 family metal-binding protein [Tetrasphaera sp. F2B08]KAB7745404.1 TIGR03084 family protein [Tetrasphaera sp. F2B08]
MSETASGTGTPRATATAFVEECEDLDALVADLSASDWARETPAVGWTIAHQIAHLAWTDEVALLSATDPEGFADVAAEAAQDPLGYVDRQAEARAALPPAELLAGWRDGRRRLADVLDLVDPDVRLDWFGPPMKPRSMATARLMETWAHGQDVADTLDVSRTPTDRLHDICHLGVRTRDWGYLINGKEAPAGEFRIELTSPSGAVWTWGPEATDGAAGTVTGSALDFCLVVTQRRDVARTDLRSTGAATEWLTFAQAFAGAPKGMRG